MVKNVAMVATLACLLAACASGPNASSGKSAYRSGNGVVESVRVAGAAAPPATTSIQSAPVGASVYSSSTYGQPAYSYPSSSPSLAGEPPREPAPGGVSARTDAYQVVVRMDDGSRQVIGQSRTGLRPGDRVEISPEGRLEARQREPARCNARWKVGEFIRGLGSDRRSVEHSRLHNDSLLSLRRVDAVKLKSHVPVQHRLMGSGWGREGLVSRLPSGN